MDSVKRCGWRRWCCKDGWPPVGVYRFGDAGPMGRGLGGPNGTAILADGADPATYRRTVGPDYSEREAPPCMDRIDRDLVREHYLTRLVGASNSAIPIHAHVSRTLVWQGPDGFTRDLSDFVQQQETAFQELAQRLAQWQQLNAEEVKNLRPALHIEILDRRSSHGPALPLTGPFPANVTLDTGGAR